MQGDARVLEALNARLSEELTAINQYTVHAEMLENWRYGKLYGPVWKRTITEMKHAEMHIGRIIFLEGKPVVSNLNPLHIGGDVQAQLENDLASEIAAVKLYNDAIRLVTEAGDNGTRVMLERILHDEEEHADWVETQLSQIEQMGIQNYLVEQMG